MRVKISPDYSNTIHRKKKLPSKIGYRVETSRSRDWITRNSNVEKKGRKGANHISLSLTSTHTYTHTHNVYSRCNEILSNYPSDHVSTPRVAVRPRMGEIPLEEGAAKRGDERLDSARVFLLWWRCARSGASSRFRFPFRSGWTRSSSWFRRSLDAKGRGWRVVAWHAKMVLAGNTRCEQERGDASRRHVPVGREGAVRAPPHRFTLRALVQACLCFDQQHTIRV